MTIYIPINLPSLSNQRMHWAAASRQKKHQQRRVAECLTPLSGAIEAIKASGPVAVELVRIAPRELDPDNMVSCFKHVQDEVAYQINPDKAVPAIRRGKVSINKGHCDKGIVWSYSQRKGKPKEYGLEVKINQ